MMIVILVVVLAASASRQPSASMAAGDAAWRDAITGQPHTAHTVGPVPFVYCGPRVATLRAGGALRDVAPTVLELAGAELEVRCTLASSPNSLGRWFHCTPLRMR